MSTKKNRLGGLVYSTNPDFTPENEEEEGLETLPIRQQKLYVSVDKKNRGGKVVTLVEGFQGREEDMELLGKQLKTACGTGGNVKDGVILIQGDVRQKVMDWLQKSGYPCIRKGG